MKLNHIAIATAGCTIAICLAISWATSLNAQYPAQQDYRSGPGYVVSPPMLSDGNSPSTSMSPDHWGTPINNSSGGFGTGMNGFDAGGGSMMVDGQSAPDFYPESTSPNGTPWGNGAESSPVSSGTPPSILDNNIPLPPSQYPPAGSSQSINGGGTFPGGNATDVGRPTDVGSSTDVESQPVSDYSSPTYTDPVFDADYGASGSPSANPPAVPMQEYFDYGPDTVNGYNGQPSSAIPPSPGMPSGDFGAPIQNPHANDVMSAQPPPVNRPPHIEAPDSGVPRGNGPPRNSIINEVREWPIESSPNGSPGFGPGNSTDIYLPGSTRTPVGLHPESVIVDGTGGFQQRLMNSVGGSTFEHRGGYPRSVTYGNSGNSFPGNIPGRRSAVDRDGVYQTQEVTGGASVLRNSTVNPSPELGFRRNGPANRMLNYDDGRTYDFENKKKEFPPFSEILATGVYYSTVELHYLQPHFQGNTAIATSTGIVEAFDFDNDPGWKIRAGFESQYGPGLDLSYFQFDQNSAPTTFTSDGITTATTSAWMVGPNEWSRLTAANAGETLNAEHSLEVQAFGAGFFKELKFPISSITGMFGFQYASIQQALEATVTDSTGTVIDRLSSTSDMRAYGPRYSFEYQRPVGHTKMILVSNFGGSLMYGNRDQFVSNSSTGDLSRLGADEFITMLDYGMAVQYRMNTGEKRFLSTKVGYSTQTWLGGGTAVLPQDDFGFRGWVFAIGINR